jgi:hypothetical protein
MQTIYDANINYQRNPYFVGNRGVNHSSPTPQNDTFRNRDHSQGGSSLFSNLVSDASQNRMNMGDKNATYGHGTID